MKNIILVAFAATLVSGFGMDFTELQARARRSTDGRIDGLVPNPGAKIKQIQCEGHDFLASNSTSYIKVPKGAHFGFHSAGETSNYPRNYKCGTAFVGETYDSKLQIKCQIRVAAGDYLTLVGQNQLDVFSNVGSTAGSDAVKVFRRMQLPAFYLGFLSNNGGRKGFWCRIQETSGTPS